MKKLLLTLGTMGSIVAPLATTIACGSNDAAPKIGVTVYNAADPFIGITTGGFNSKAKELDIPISIADAANDQTKTNEAVDTFITRSVEALVVGLVDPTAASTIVQKGNAADTPVIFYNKEPETSVVDATKDVYYIGATEEDAGRIQGDLIFADMQAGIIKDRNGDGDFDFKMFAGEASNVGAIDRTNFVQLQLKERLAAITDTSDPLYGMTINQIGETEWTDWSETDGKELMDTAISAEAGTGLIDMVITNNDGVALGAVQSLKAGSGFVALPEDLTTEAASWMHVPVYGVDATDPAKASIKEGWMGGTVLNDGAGQGEIAIQLAYNIMNEEASLLVDMPAGIDWDTDTTNSTPNSVIRVPFLPVTRDDV